MPRYHYENQLTNYMADKPVMRATAVGEGIIDYDTFIGALKEIGYQGYLVYEMCEVLDGGGSIVNLDATAKKFLDYVKRSNNFFNTIIEAFCMAFHLFIFCFLTAKWNSHIIIFG
jgi:sugar phosphate isomerase/epimerase